MLFQRTQMSTLSHCLFVASTISFALSMVPLANARRDEQIFYGRYKRTILSFPYRRILKGAKRTDQSFFGARIYHKPEGFAKARKDFLSVNPRDVKTPHDGAWSGVVNNKEVYLRRFEDDKAILQVYSKRFGLSGFAPILSIMYDGNILLP